MATADFLSTNGFNRSKPRRRRPLRPTVPDVISDQPHVHQCTKRLFNGEACDRRIGPYYNHTLYKEALAQHLATQHVNDLSAMSYGDKADERMYRADTDGQGYEPPSW
jgi:hypothetical protein